ncbi:MAG: hypothetical protein ABIN58_03255, partial [candidate division WOR-3 bacterium]
CQHDQLMIQFFVLQKSSCGSLPLLEMLEDRVRQYRYGIQSGIKSCIRYNFSQATFPSELPPFLDPDRCARLRAFTNLQPAVDPDLVAIARQVLANPALLHLAWHCHRLVYHPPEYPHADIARFPWLESNQREDSAGEPI